MAKGPPEQLLVDLAGTVFYLFAGFVLAACALLSAPLIVLAPRN